MDVSASIPSQSERESLTADIERIKLALQGTGVDGSSDEDGFLVQSDDEAGEEQREPGYLGDDVAVSGAYQAGYTDSIGVC